MSIQRILVFCNFASFLCACLISSPTLTIANYLVILFILFYWVIDCWIVSLLTISYELHTETQDTSLKRDDIPLTVRIRASIGTALGAAAARSKLLADQEDREIENLVTIIMETQVALNLGFLFMVHMLFNFFLLLKTCHLRGI